MSDPPLRNTLPVGARSLRNWGHLRALAVTKGAKRRGPEPRAARVVSGASGCLPSAVFSQHLLKQSLPSWPRRPGADPSGVAKEEPACSLRRLGSPADMLSLNVFLENFLLTMPGDTPQAFVWENHSGSCERHVGRSGGCV